MTKKQQTREPAARFDLNSVRREWDIASDAYADAQERGLDYYRLNFFGPAMVDACGNVNALEVLDLGCGTGYFSRQMAQNGASKVVGVDISPNQLAHARRLEEKERLGIEYIQGDAAAVVDNLPETSFDLVTACVSLVDMPDPRRVINGAHRILRDRGRLVFTNTHPITDTMYREWVRDHDGNKIGLEIGDYFNETPFTLTWMSDRYKYPFQTTGNSYTLQTWMRWVIQSGFIIEDFIEPYATDEAITQWPGLDDTRIAPLFLIIVARKDARITPQNEESPLSLDGRGPEPAPDLIRG